jgi:pyruvate dehydrogenase E2 component (dihydrolipoamide acetyltransferase)
MATPIIMPKFGQMTEESAIVEWLKKEGDAVAKGDILFTVETDKSVMEVESFETGTLLKIVVPPRLTVPVQSTVGFLGMPGEPVPAVTVPAPLPPPPRQGVGAAAAAGPDPVPMPPSRAADPQSAGAALAPPPPAASSFVRISPRAARLAADCAIDPAPVRGSGPNGRIVERDVRAYLEARGYSRIRISPAAKQLAAHEKLDLLSIPLAGESSRILVADVQRALAERPKPMSKMRQIIAQRLTQSVVTAPHFYVTVPVDLTDLLQLRARLKERGATYTVTDFVSQAVVLSLSEFPNVNASTDGKTIRFHSHVHLGLAVSIDEGLVVPVIPRAEELTLAEISAQSRTLADKARQGRLTPDQMTGGTFTISNLGMLDVENFTAIINPGEGAILAVSSAVKQPVVRDDKIVVRSVMKMTLSSDHRLIDGVLAARFANAIKQKLQDLDLWRSLTAC